MAVAYDKEFFIGKVQKKTKKGASVQFVERVGHTDQFKWPNRKDKDNVTMKYIFVPNINVIEQSNNQVKVVEILKLEKLFQDFRNKYF